MRLRNALIAIPALLGAGLASAADTRVAKLHNIDAGIRGVLEKDSMPATKLVREHFAGMPGSKIEAYAKSKKLDPQAFLRVVWQAELLMVEPLQVGHAWLLVNHCNVQGLAQLKGSRGADLAKCISEAPGRDGIIKTVPTAEEADAWVAEAKRGEAGQAHTPERSLPIARLEGVDAKLIAAFGKKGWKTNLDVVKNLSVSGERDAFAKATKVKREAVELGFGVADLLRVGSINGPMALLIFDAGVTNVGELGGQRPDDFFTRLNETNGRTHRVGVAFTVEAVTRFVDDAKGLAQHK